jgi:uncharacterized CHY-type Zn-finger protein
MEPANKSPEIDTFLTSTFGRSRIESVRGNKCVLCGQSSTEFRDELSRREFGISGTCQTCQDKVFDEPEED